MKTSLNFLIFCGVIFLSSCSEKPSEKGGFDKITDGIFYDVIVGDTMYKADKYQYFEEKDRVKFVQKIKDFILSGKLKAYRPNDLGEDVQKDEFIIKSDDFNALFIDSIYTSIIDESGTATQEKLEVKEISNVMLTKFEFREDWFFNEEALQLEKKVKSISFMHEVFTEEGELKGHKKLFTVYLN